MLSHSTQVQAPRADSLHRVGVGPPGEALQNNSRNRALESGAVASIFWHAELAELRKADQDWLEANSVVIDVKEPLWLE